MIIYLYSFQSYESMHTRIQSINLVYSNKSNGNEAHEDHQKFQTFCNKNCL